MKRRSQLYGLFVLLSTLTVVIAQFGGCPPNGGPGCGPNAQNGGMSGPPMVGNPNGFGGMPMNGGPGFGMGGENLIENSLFTILFLF